MIDELILSNLLYNEPYASKVIQHIQPDYFDDAYKRNLFTLINLYFKKYKKLPTKEVLLTELESAPNLSEEKYNEYKNQVNELSFDPDNSLDWLVDTTEKYCKEQALHNAIHKSIEILEDDQQEKGSIPKRLQEALNVSFSTSIGHDYIDNVEDRYDFYHTKEDKIPFDIDILNIITKGGLSKKTLSVFLAPTGIGKSTIMCHLAVAAYLQGLNVVYISLEMSEEMIGERFDMNILDKTEEQIKNLTKEQYISAVSSIKDRTLGKLIVQEYPTKSAGPTHFRHFLHELSVKKKIVPDLVFVDYIGICKNTSGFVSRENTNSNMTPIAEDLRGLATEFNIPMVTAAQVNREGMKSSDFDIDNIAEAIGITHTVDLMIGAISIPELEEVNQILFKQLKNRRAPATNPSKFVVGLDRTKMRMFNVEEDSVTEGLIQDGSKANTAQDKFGGVT